MHQAFIALGANQGDPVGNIRCALERIGQLDGVSLVRASSLFRTAPIGLTDQADFINAVAEIRTSLGPESLLTELLHIEMAGGRVRHLRNGPRTLDLDLLLYDAVSLSYPALTLPHPRLHLRAFVLVPLAEIAPNLEIPGRGTVAAWLPAVANQTIERLR